MTNDEQPHVCSHPSDAVMWNQFNQVIQCHICGQTLPFTPEQEQRIREIVAEVLSEVFKHPVTVNPAYRGNPSEDND